MDDSTPEDVAALYAWAHVTGARYRDFSAVRREQRARLRLETARRSLQQELKADAWACAEAAGEPVIAARRSAGAAGAALREIEEEREIAEARASARRKAMAFDQAEERRRERMGPQPGTELARGEAGGGTDGAEYAAMGGAGGPQLDAERDFAGQASEPIALREPTAVIRPAWLQASAEMPWPDEVAVAPTIAAGALARVGAAAATLLDSREQVAARWPVLRRLVAEMHPVTARMSWPRGPVAAIVSPVSGAGKTSLAASLARALAGAGERVLAVATDADSLLPVCFGVAGLGRDEIRVATSPGRSEGSISVMALRVGSEDKRARERGAGVLLERARGCDRIVVELAPEDYWLAGSLAVLRPMVLATMAPELNSLTGVRAMEQRFVGITDRDGRPLLPFYLLNCFDAGLPLHLDMRELLRSALGERLLTATVRRSAAVNEALAEGTTAIDYAPEAPIARDYADVATWLRSVSAKSAEAIAAAREGR